jgi:hypothetical protein
MTKRKSTKVWQCSVYLIVSFVLQEKFEDTESVIKEGETTHSKPVLTMSTGPPIQDQ